MKALSRLSQRDVLLTAALPYAHHVQCAWCVSCATQQIQHGEVVTEMSDTKLSQVLHLWWHVSLVLSEIIDLFFGRQLLLLGTTWRWKWVPNEGRLWGRSSPLLHKTWTLWAPPWTLLKKPSQRPSMHFLSKIVKAVQIDECCWSLCWADLACFSLFNLNNVFGCALVTGTTSGKHMMTASSKTYFIDIPWVITKTWLEIWKNLFLFKYNKQHRLEICKNCWIIFLSLRRFVWNAFVHVDRYEE